MVKFKGETVFTQPVLKAYIEHGWNNSMGSYYPSIIFVQFLDGQVKSESHFLGEHHNPGALESELQFEADPAQKRAYDAMREAQRDAKERGTLRQGKTVKVVRGRKVPQGTVGRILKMGVSSYGPWLLIETAQGDKIVVSERNCEIISQTDSLTQPTFIVQVTRLYSITHDVEVQAETDLQARIKAIEISNDMDHTGRLQLDDTQAHIARRA